MRLVVEPRDAMPVAGFSPAGTTSFASGASGFASTGLATRFRAGRQPWAAAGSKGLAWLLCLAVGMVDRFEFQQFQVLKGLALPVSRVGVIRPFGVGIYRPVEAMPKRISKHRCEGAILQRLAATQPHSRRTRRWPLRRPHPCNCRPPLSSASPATTPRCFGSCRRLQHPIS